ncbi:MAG: VacJ family lipoprotein [Gammaproteobacteria bacterium]|nr:VacJ family lipoprotein [Gammaproteobacteria bacterium]
MKIRIKTIVCFYLILLSPTWAFASPTASTDPLEGINRASFWLTEELDQLLIRPVSVAYNYAIPDAGQTVVGNFYDNLLEIPSVVGDILQAKWALTGHGVGRFLVNSTLGAAGLFDVASRLGLERHREDMGQTLGYWGVPAGPYLFIPLLGPSTARDSTGLLFDLFLSPHRYIDAMALRNTLYGIDITQRRANLLESEKSILGDKYVFFRDYYLNYRLRLIRDGGEIEPEELDFGDDFDEEF